MKRSVRNFFSFVKKAFQSWWEKDPFRQSAVIAYYSIFSLPGLMVVIIAIAGFFLSPEDVSRHVLNYVGRILGTDTQLQLEEIIETAGEFKGSVFAVIAGVATIIFGATTVFAQFQKSLNIIWEVKAAPEKSGIWDFVKVRLFSFGLILTIAFILLMSLAISSAIAAMTDWLKLHLPEFLLVLVHVLNFLLSLVIISGLFALMFKVFPDAEVYWRDVWLGAIVTGLLFLLGEFALSLYFGTAHPGKGYGAAGGVILLLLWSSYSSMIVFYGAEFTKSYAEHHRKEIPATKTAKKEKGREN